MFESNILTKNSKILEFLIIRGLDTITHVFLNLLCYTKNVELVFFHCEKSFYFYLEFVSQISHEDRSFLQLSSRDACNYVYKKTIYDVPLDMKHKNKLSEKTKAIMNIVSLNINIYKIILRKMITKFIQSADDIKKSLNIFYELVTAVNALNLTDTELILLSAVTNVLHQNVSDLDVFISFYEKMVDKIGKQPATLNSITVDKMHDINYKELNPGNIDSCVTNVFRV